MTDKEKLEKLKKLADTMYYTAANLGPTVGSGEHLRKTMEEYHKFIIHEYYKEKPINEYLEEVAMQYGTDEFPSLCNGCKHIPIDAFKAGAKWQKKQIMKDSIDGEIQFGTVKVQKEDIKEAVESLREGDKVKVIVIKEG